MRRAQRHQGPTADVVLLTWHLACQEGAQPRLPTNAYELYLMAMSGVLAKALHSDASTRSGDTAAADTDALQEALCVMRKVAQSNMQHDTKGTAQRREFKFECLQA